MTAAVRVSYDTTALLTGNAGVARYVRELDAALGRLDVQLERFAIGRRARSSDGAARSGTTAVRRVPVPLRAMHRSWARFGAPSAERFAPRGEIVHTPDLVPPPTRRPLVMTVHDLDAITYPDLHPPRAVAVQHEQLAAARDRARVVLSVSQATADALAERGVAPDRIAVTPNGVTPLPAPDRSIVPGHPFVLAVGSLSPRKGFTTLVEAFVHAAVPDDVRLVLAGGDGWNANEVHETLERAGRPGRVLRVGAVTDAQLAGLYAACLAVCVPSRAEGFGLPVVEAAAAGAPVVASDLPVFRELGETVACFVPADDAAAWSAALEGIVGDPTRRQRAATTARAAAASYTWDRTAAMTLAAYERAREDR